MMNSKANRIYLIGMMASGKSTIGALLAKRLGYTFVDMDAEIEANAGKSISQMFADEGEEHFRELESELLKKLSHKSKLVISTGGGTPIHHNGIDRMLRTGRVVWLKVSIDTIYNRLQNDSTRPLAKQITKYQLSRLIRSRNPIYKRADIRIWNKGKVADVVDRIREILRKRAVEEKSC